MRIGRVQSIHRFPVKSMAGEELERVEVGLEGLAGDRGFAIRDEAASEIRGGKRLPKVMMCSARYADHDLKRAIVEFPDGSTSNTDDPQLARRISTFLGREVTVWPLMPASNKEHYRRVQPGAAVAGVLARSNVLRKAVSKLAMVGPSGRELREDFGRTKDEPLPDLSVFPAEIFEFVSPLGTYFDAYPIHIVTTATLDTLRAKHPDGDWDARRFRPNFVIETEPSLQGLAETEWEGRILTVGGLRLECTVATPRCSMVGQPTPNLKKDTSVLRTIVREANQCVGIYARVLQGAPVQRGAEVTLP
ncbi:MAG: MOSC N-terminal beta barrel domain-containing protein [Polyangiales bacterium]